MDAEVVLLGTVPLVLPPLDGEQVVLGHEPAQGTARGEPLLAVEREVDAAVDAAPPRFRRRRVEAAERPGHARQAVRAHGEMVTAPEPGSQNPGRRAADDTVRRGV